VTVELLELTCPRCGAACAERFYGPCETCRSQLRADQQGERHDVVTERFEPAMHVTPNAVALKE
jgi:hypothetical protein